MKWFAAHIVMSVELKDARQDYYPVWENIVLVAASSEAEAFSRAEKRGLQEAGDDDGSFTWGGKPARWVYQGVRKLTECDLMAKCPGDGDELSYNELEFPSLRAVEQFAAGKAVTATMTDRFPSKGSKGSGTAKRAKRKGA